MTTTPDEVAPSGPFGPSTVGAEADGLLAARARSSGQYLAGLIADAELETAARPDRLPADLFPDVDPGVVQAIWDRALAVGLYAGRVSSAPRLYRDQMARAAAELEAIGFHAMASLVSGSRRLVAPDHVHPADMDSPRERSTAV